jgi:SulP family sulfate permease
MGLASDLRADLVAGATVAMVGIPQCIAYATMGGLPPVYGLTTAIVPGLVAAVVGRSVSVATGPTNTTTLLILGVVLPFVGAQGITAEGLRWVATLTLLCGLLRLALAWGGGAVLLRFLPESVVAGFIVGAGILIGLMQVDEALGLPPVSAANAWAEISGLAAQLAVARPSGLAVGFAVVTAAAVELGRRISPRLPMALAVVFGGALLAWALGLDAGNGLPLVSDREVMPSGWPPLAMPLLDLDVMGRLLMPASAIVLLGSLELIVAIRAEDPRADVKREIVAQGAANVAGAFAAAFPASASLTRSVLLRMGNPRSRAAAAFSAVLVLPVLLFGSGLIARIPQASLAGVLLVIAAAMVRQPVLGRMWNASGPSRLLLGVTIVSTLVLPLAWAVFVGAGLGVLIHLARTSVPRVRSLTFKDGRLVAIEEGHAPMVLVLEISGAVHYAAVDPLLDQVERQLSPDVRIVIVDLSHAHELRFTGLRALEWWAADLAKRSIRLRLAGVTPEVLDLIRNAKSQLEYTMWDPEPGRSAWNSLQQLRDSA